MSHLQKQVLLILALIGLGYFAAFFIPNMQGIDHAAQSSRVGDEIVTYPNVVRMLTPGETFNETRARIFLYEDYHYGYPFYALSALTLLPVKLIYGDAFPQQAALNLLLLRQFISVLPMVLAAGVMVYVQTRFKSLWKSLALFVFLLSVRGIVRNHIQWWHPDALTVLFIALTILFLSRDRLRFGRDFYLAAVMCGLATAIKLAGVFFFLTIPALLLAGLLVKRISLKRAVIAGGLFVVLMSATVVVSNPFLFSDEQRERMLMIQSFKQEELSQGYSHDDPLYYSKGPQWWASTLEKWYGSPLFLGFLVISMIAGCFYGRRKFENRIIFSWVAPYSIYLLYFVAPKPDHYWLPVMLPLFSCAFTLVDLFLERAPTVSRWPWQKFAAVAVALVLVGQFVFNLAYPISGNLAWYTAAVTNTLP